MSYQNEPASFPEFKIEELELYAKKWVEDYEILGIERILLYRNKKLPLGWKDPIRYLLVFEISLLNEMEQPFNSRPSKRLFNKPIPSTQCWDIFSPFDVRMDHYPTSYDPKCIIALKEIEFAVHFADQDNYTLFDKSFSGVVYKEKPDENIFKEWQIVLKKTGRCIEEIILKDRPFRILYDSKKHITKSIDSTPSVSIPENDCEIKLWKDIKITLIAHDMVRIKFPKTEKRFTYHELGMSDKRTGNKPKLIWILLELFAKYNGRLDSDIEESVKRHLWQTYNFNYEENLPNLTKRLNAHMKKFFGIDESIFRYHYRKEKGYSTRFEIKTDMESINKGMDSSSNIKDDQDKAAFDVEYESITDKLNLPESSYYRDETKKDPD
jgi:hypothetical protein